MSTRNPFLPWKEPLYRGGERGTDCSDDPSDVDGARSAAGLVDKGARRHTPEPVLEHGFHE